MDEENAGGICLDVEVMDINPEFALDTEDGVEIVLII